ncbi:MAG: oligopeptidase B, partial [Elusimicrobiota bacterium]
MSEHELSGLLAFAFLALGLSGFARASEPPQAKKIPHELVKHGQARTDEYYWLKDRKNPEVTAYLKAENDYAAAAMKHTEKFQGELFREMKGRIKEDDSTVPFKYGEYYYYKTYKKGLEYPVYARKKGSTEAAEEVLLDVNELAEGKAFCQVKFPAIRPDHKMIAYAVDTGGRRFYDVYFKDLVTGRLYGDKIANTSGNMAWANDNRTLFHVKQNPETLRWERVFAHELGRLRDIEVYFEADETFEISLSRSKTGKYIFLRSGSTLSTEYRLVAAEKPSEAPVIFQARQPKLEYDIEDGGDEFYVLNNENAPNFKVSICPSSDTSKSSWSDLVPHREDTLVEYLDVFEEWLVLKERFNAQGSFHVFSRIIGMGDSRISFDEPAYVTDLGENFEYQTHTLRVTYESLTTPDSVYDVDLRTGGRVLMKRQEVVGG